MWINAVAVYFASGRLPGTRWHHFDPGLQTRADIQRLMIDDLRRNHVRWVVRDASWDDANEPNASFVSSGIKLLDQYLDSQYRPIARSGKVEFLLDRSEPNPGPGPADACLGKP